MEAVALWLLENVYNRFVGGPARMILGRILGGRYRSLRDDLEALKRNPGNGEAAARLIVRVQPFEKSVSIFNDFKLATRRIAEVRLYLAIFNRLHTEGMTPATVEYLKCENNENDYEWAIQEIIDEAAKKVPSLPAALERDATDRLNSLQYQKDEEGG